MGLYLKRFVFASLLYLGLGVIFGVLNGVTDIGYAGYYAHSHFNLLGFMSMMIFGIAYFILPRFNGADLRFPSWIPVHFWVGNISLIGMVCFRGLQVSTGEDIFNVLFILFASLQAITIFMFIINVWVTLAAKPKENAEEPEVQPEAAPEPDQQPATSVFVTPDSKVGELVDACPSLMEILVGSGLKSLAMPGHIDKVRTIGVTVGMAATNHGIDLDDLIVKIETELKAQGFNTSAPSADPVVVKSVITSNAMIGDILKDYPEANKVFQKHFGDGCFDCPGQAYETVEMACGIHGIESKSFLMELNSAISS